MDVKEAVKTAKGYVSELFAEDGLTNIGLEEVEHDDGGDVWRVTVGFSRPWDTPRNAALTSIIGENRSYRVVAIKDDGTVLSVKLRNSLTQ